MQADKRRLFHHRNPFLPLPRRIFEWFLILTLFSMVAAAIIGFAAIFWNAKMGGLSQADIVSRGKTPVAFILLCLAWWFSLSTFLARRRTPVSTPAAARASAPPLLPSLAENPKTTFLIAPVWAFVLTQLTSTLTWPTLQLNLFGHGIEQLARTEKLGTVRNAPKSGESCSTSARLTLSPEMQLDRCLAEDLYAALQPGDGVLITFLTHGDLMRFQALRLIQAAEMPAVLALDPELNALLLRRAARDQSGTRAQ